MLKRNYFYEDRVMLPDIQLLKFKTESIRRVKLVTNK